ncbi:response regulator receiver domain protein [Ostertagia ostertagi]
MDRIKQILIVDDDPDYIHLVERALSACHSPCTLKSLSSGDNLLVWLKTSQRPSLILLDIDMPGVSGFDTLSQLKAIERYKVIPVVIVSMSTEKQDMIYSYNNGASGYIKKAETFEELKVSMQLFSRYWVDTAYTPDSSWSKPDDFSYK